MSDQVIPAGWYADPNDASQLRWWDGAVWSDHYSPLPPAAPAVPSPTGPAINIPAPAAVGAPAPAPSASEPSAQQGLLEHAANLVDKLPGKAGGTIAAGAAMASAAVASRSAKPEVAPVASPAPSTQPETVPPAVTEVKPSFMDQRTRLVGDRRAQGGAIGAAGAALAAGGAASLIRKNGGGRKASKVFLVGVIIFFVGIFGLIAGISQAFTGPTDVTVSGQVTKIQTDAAGLCIPTVEFRAAGTTRTVRPTIFATCTWEVGDETPVTYTTASAGTVAKLGSSTTAASGSAIPGSIMLLIAGLVTAIWALVLLAIRAGSIVGGAYLIREGLRRAKTHEPKADVSAGAEA